MLLVFIPLYLAVGANQKIKDFTLAESACPLPY